MRRFVVVRFTRQGFHRWENAPEHRAYLRDDHRHLFHIEVKVAVDGEDREVEFHDLLSVCEAEWNRWPVNLGTMSCEHMARKLMLPVNAAFPGREMAVKVFEDGEVGAEVIAEVGDV